MNILLAVLIIISSILLIFVVYAQNPKGGGLSSDFGAAQQIGGVQKTNDFIVKATWFLASLIMIFSVSLTLRTNQGKPDTTENANQEQTQPAGKGQPNPAQGNKPAPNGGQ